MEAETRYARSGDVSIAYQVIGDGPFDVVFVPGSASNVELSWTSPRLSRFYERLASFGRLILFDKRGTGLSDRVEGVPPLETRMDDVRAVMEAAGSKRAAVVGVSEGGPMTALFAATYPERTWAAVIYGGFVRGTWSPEFPYEPTIADMERRIAVARDTWGSREAVVNAIRKFAPSVVADERELEWWQQYLRHSSSPGAAIALARMNMEVDISGILPAIRVPTLIVHRTGDQACDVRAGRYMAEQIPGARLVELPGEDHAPWYGDTEGVLGAIEEFLTATWSDAEREVDVDRVLATVLFTDIVGSTAKAAEIGDTRWRDLIHDHHALIRRQLIRFRGDELDTAGDGFFASFDGPARAIRCACAISQSVRDLGIDVRAGLHTGECERIDGKVGGIAVNIGARVAAEAGPGEVLVSGTVKDLVAGSGITFRERGATELRGVPGEWRLFAVETA